MDPIAALRGILISAIPTFILVWILYLYVSRVFYVPLRQTLDKRHAATAGLRQQAEERLSLVEKKGAEYEQALRTNRAELFHQQEAERQLALNQRAAILQTAREKSHEKIAHAREAIAREASDARQSLDRQSEEMARWITQAVLEPSAARPPFGSKS